jgi:predicted urease superfamily metal-dependent hydrolase
MVLKTFNLDERVYEEYSKHCKKEGISMSKRIEGFIKIEVEKSKMTKFFPSLKEASQIQIPDALETSRTKVQTDHKMSKYC